MSINAAAATGENPLNVGDHAENNVFSIGEKVLIRTVTYHCIGRVVGFSYCMGTPFVFLEEAGFLAVSHQFSEGLKKGLVGEYEPIPGLYRVNVASIVDACQWPHRLPRTVDGK